MDAAANVLLPDDTISNKTTRIALPDNLDQILRSEKENQLIQKIFPVMGRTKIFQDSYFLYDHSNLVKKYFITELSKFISIYSRISYSGEKRKKRIDIASPKNISYKKKLFLQLTKVCGKTEKK